MGQSALYGLACAACRRSVSNTTINHSPAGCCCIQVVLSVLLLAFAHPSGPVLVPLAGLDLDQLPSSLLVVIAICMQEQHDDYCHQAIATLPIFEKEALTAQGKDNMSSVNNLVKSFLQDPGPGHAMSGQSRSKKGKKRKLTEVAAAAAAADTS